MEIDCQCTFAVKIRTSASTHAMSKKSVPVYYVPALEKGLDVLEALASAASPQTLTELARALNRSSSVLFRIIDALEKRGYIVRDPVSGAYRLTLKLYELAHTHSPVDHMLKAAALPLRELADSIHESCHLAVLAHGGLVIVAQELSRDRARLSVEVGSRALPVHTVSGRRLIAFFSPESREAFLKLDLDYRTMSRAKKDAFLAELQKIRRDGYKMARSESRIGIDIATLVGNPATGVMASLAVPCLAGGRNEGREKDLVTPLRATAHRITTALGLTLVEDQEPSKAAVTA
jgi:DNA-binding IclR family transcriptional regulator